MRPCLTSEEAELWARANRKLDIKAGDVCFDCTMAFHLEQLALGQCNGTPKDTGRPPEDTIRVKRGMGRPLVDDPDPIVTKRRAQWAKAARLRRVPARTIMAQDLEPATTLARGRETERSRPQPAA